MFILFPCSPTTLHGHTCSISLNNTKKCLQKKKVVAVATRPCVLIMEDMYTYALLFLYFA